MLYDIIEAIIGHNWVTGDSSQQYIYYACVVVIVLVVSVVLDLLYRGFGHIWRGKS